jgi:4-diphosphocytidyl-2-C-methyl-D-erythritol kinase
VTLAPAKINVVLRVGPRRPDGFHEVVSALAALDVGDELELEPAARTSVEAPGLDGGDTLVGRGLDLLAREAPWDGGWQVRIAKRIPAGAGLGGGSSDAGTALRLANAMLPEPVPARRLLELAAAVGSDVPFFATGWPAALARGRGERLVPLAAPPPLGVVLAWPGVALSTAAVYEAYRPASDGAALAATADALAREGLVDPVSLLANDLAATAEALCPASASLRRELEARGALASTVSGSGSAVVALFASRPAAEAAIGGLAGASWAIVAGFGRAGTVKP